VVGERALAERFDVEMIGQVPMQIAMREGSDTGHPIVGEDPDAEASLVFAQMAGVGGQSRAEQARSPRTQAHLTHLDQETPVDIRIGVSETPREITMALAADTDRNEVKDAVAAALAGASDTLWLVDDKGRDIAIPAAKIAYVELGPDSDINPIGFG